MPHESAAVSRVKGNYNRNKLGTTQHQWKKIELGGAIKLNTRIGDAEVDVIGKVITAHFLL